jgi:outer membrane murein-binding lipoprotein Lpp
MRGRLPVTLMVPLALVAAALIAAGCGSSNSKPAYCSDVSNLKKSVDNLKSVQLKSGALSTLQTNLEEVQSDANAVVSSAKQDFPSQTSALESSVSSLSTAIKQLPSSPTAQQLASLVPRISSTVTAAKNLESATSSACD